MNIEMLRQTYKTIEVRNKRNIVTAIPLGNGAEVVLNPRQTGKVMTKDLTQIPDPRLVTLVNPTLADLMDAGILASEDTVGADG